MPDTNNEQQSIVSDKDALKGGTTDAELWMKKVKAQQSADQKGWHKQAKEAVKLYEADGDDDTDNPFNIFHSNVETLIPAIYNSSPIPDVRRRYGDKSMIDKNVADVCERLLSESVDSYELDDEIEAVLLDGEVAGRGVARVRYRPKITIEQVVGEDGQPTETQKIVRQDTELERVEWDKVVIGPAKSWSKVPWIAFPHEFDQEELESLNKEKAASLSLDTTDNKKDADKGVYKTTKVWEIWCKKKREIIYIAEQDDKLPLVVIPDPLEFESFFPLLKPYQPVKRISSMKPVTPYKVYKSLTNELEENTKRIKKLIRTLKVRGIFDAELTQDITNMLESEDVEFTPAENATKFATTGLDKAISYFPMEPQVKALQQLYLQREQIKQNIYEITGLSDIVRGATDARETAKAQQIKSQWGSLRIQRRQVGVARLARELFRKKCEVFSNHYTDEQISIITGLPQQDDQSQVQIWPKVLETLRSDMVSYRIDIETDSTIRGDQAYTQEQMNSFLTGTGNFAAAMGGVVQLHPQILPVVIEIYTAFARKFQLGKQAEDALEQLSQAAPKVAEKFAQEQGAEQGQQDPAAAQKAQQEAEQAKLAAEKEAKQQERADTMRLKELEIEAKKEIEIAKAEAAGQADVAKTQSAERIKAAELIITASLKQMELRAAHGDSDSDQLDATMSGLMDMVTGDEDEDSELSSVVAGLSDQINSQQFAPPPEPQSTQGSENIEAGQNG